MGYVQGMCDLLAPLMVILDDGENPPSRSSVTVHSFGSNSFTAPVEVTALLQLKLDRNCK